MSAAKTFSGTHCCHPELAAPSTCFAKTGAVVSGYSKKHDKNITAKEKLKNSSENLGEKSHSIRQVFIETLSAQIMAAPIIALFMGNFAPYGLIANILVLPFLPLTMLLTFIAGIGAFLLPHPLAIIVAQPATWLLNYIIGIANWVADFPGASQSIEISGWAVAGIFVIIFAIVVYLRLKTKHALRDSNVVE